MLTRDAVDAAARPRLVRVRPAGPGAAASRQPGRRRVSAERRPLAGADLVVGIVFGFLAGSNLTQGSWIAQAPWLDVTTLSFALALPAALFAITRRVPLPAFIGMLFLIGSLTFGFTHPAASTGAEHKRLGIVFAVAFVSVAAVLTLSNRRRITAFLATITALALVVVAGQFLVPDPTFLATGRRTPLGLNSIGAGRIIGAGLVIVIAATTAPSNRRRILPLLTLALPLVVGLVLTGSRGPLLGVATAVLLIVWRQPRLRRRDKFFVSGLLIGLGYVLYEALLATNSRVASSSLSGRSRLYSDAVQVASAHPMGIGWGNFFRYVQSSLAASEQGENLYAHNIFLEFWIEAGVAGVLLFAVFLAVVATRALPQTETSLGLALSALALALLVGALFSSDIIGNRMMWVSFGAILAGGGGARALGQIRSGR